MWCKSVNHTKKFVKCDHMCDHTYKCVIWVKSHIFFTLCHTSFLDSTKCDFKTFIGYTADCVGPLWWRLLRCQICLFPHPLCGWPRDSCGGGGYRWSVWVRIFFLKSLELEIFSLTYKSVSFFVSIMYIMSDNYCFSVQDIIFLSYILATLFRSKSVCRIFFSEITHNPLKSQMAGS